MANSKISALPAAATPLAGTETLPVVQGGITEQVTVANLTAGRAVSALSYAAGNLSIAGNAITSTSGTVDLRPASSGFVTIGSARNASWAASVNSLSGGDIYSLSADGTNSNSFALASNAYRTASGTPGSWSYAATSSATLYAQDRGRHYFYSAASGTLNNAITWVPVISTAATGGNVTINTGNVVQGTAAKGFNFTANTPAAGMTSQLLNWYEEGTFTPTVSGVTLASSSGRYTRTGRQVLVSFDITWPVTANATAIVIGSMPFAPAANSGALSTGYSTYTSALVGVAGTAGIALYGYLGNPSSAPQNVHMSGLRLIASCVYTV